MVTLLLRSDACCSVDVVIGDDTGDKDCWSGVDGTDDVEVDVGIGFTTSVNSGVTFEGSEQRKTFFIRCLNDFLSGGSGRGGGGGDCCW